MKFSSASRAFWREPGSIGTAGDSHRVWPLGDSTLHRESMPEPPRGCMWGWFSVFGAGSYSYEIYEILSGIWIKIILLLNE